MAQTGHLESLFAYVTQSHKRLVKSENVCFVVYHVRSFPRYQEIIVCRMQDGILAIFFDVGSPAGADCSQFQVIIRILIDREMPRFFIILLSAFVDCITSSWSEHPTSFLLLIGNCS